MAVYGLCLRLWTEIVNPTFDNTGNLVKNIDSFIRGKAGATSGGAMKAECATYGAIERSREVQYSTVSR